MKNLMISVLLMFSVYFPSLQAETPQKQELIQTKSEPHAGKTFVVIGVTSFVGATLGAGLAIHSLAKGLKNASAGHISRATSVIANEKIIITSAFLGGVLTAYFASEYLPLYCLNAFWLTIIKLKYGRIF